MAWDKGFNFRASSGYVSDGANETYVLADDGYPTTRNGVTFGWDGLDSGQDRDRDSGVDRRLAGIVFANNGGTQYNFRVDLNSTGDYEINLAMGDTGGGQDYQYCQFKDNTSVLRTIDDSDGTAFNNYDDATGVNRAEAAWPGSNAKDTQTFATTIFFLLVGTPGSEASATTIAHLFLSEVAAGGRIMSSLVNHGGLVGHGGIAGPGGGLAG